MPIKKAFSVAALVLFFSLARSDVQAQTEQRKFEVSLLYTTINLQAFDTRESGGGVRLSYNINSYLAVEAEGSMFESIGADSTPNEFLGAQGLVGIKAGLRNRWIGVFAKVRPGVANFPKLRVRRGFCFREQSCASSERSGNRFALDAGAVIEVYPTEKFIVRIDIGDTMIRFKDELFFRSPTTERIKDGFTHNAQLGVGVGFRF